jgi:hypothetical protein
MGEAAPHAAESRTGGEQPGDDGETAALRRTARNYGVAAYLACRKVGDWEEAARIAAEMQALGLPAPDAQSGGEVTVS